MSSRIIYYDTAIGTKDKVAATADSSLAIAKVSEILRQITPTPYITLERQGIDLNDNRKRFYHAGNVVGWVSASTSDGSGHFETPPKITLTFADGYYSSPGITLYFYDAYCSHVLFTYYRDNIALKTVGYSNSEMIRFFAAEVENYNKIVISINETQYAHSFAKIYRIDFGRCYELNSFYSVNLLEEIYEHSDDLSINTLEFTVNSEEDLSLKENQNIEYYHNDGFMGNFAITTAKKESFTRYTVTAQDNVGLLDDMAFKGGVYANKPVLDLIREISTAAGLEIRVESDVDTLAVSGWLPVCTCRYALAQVAFAAGAVVDTSRNGVIALKDLGTSVSSVITNDRILGTAEYEKKDRVTQVDLTSYRYGGAEDQAEMLFRGTANREYIEFGKPMYSYGGLTGTVTMHEWTPNYMIISGTDVEIKGYPYVEQKSVYTKKAGGLSGKENIASYDKYTLISKGNAENRLNTLFNRLTRNIGTVRAEIVLDNEHVGDMVQIVTRYNGIMTGIITSLDITAGNKYLTAEAVIEVWQ